MAEQHDDIVRTRKTSRDGVPEKKKPVKENRWNLRMRMAPEKEFRALLRIAASLQVLCLLLIFGVTDVLAQSSRHSRGGPVSLSVLIQGDGTVTSSPPGLSCHNGICGGGTSLGGRS